MHLPDVTELKQVAASWLLQKGYYPQLLLATYALVMLWLAGCLWSYGRLFPAKYPKKSPSESTSTQRPATEVSSSTCAQRNDTPDKEDLDEFEIESSDDDSDQESDVAIEHLLRGDTDEAIVYARKRVRLAVAKRDMQKQVTALAKLATVLNAASGDSRLAYIDALRCAKDMVGFARASEGKGSRLHVRALAGLASQLSAMGISSLAKDARTKMRAVRGRKGQPAAQGGEASLEARESDRPGGQPPPQAASGAGSDIADLGGAAELVGSRFDEFGAVGLTGNAVGIHKGRIGLLFDGTGDDEPELSEDASEADGQSEDELEESDDSKDDDASTSSDGGESDDDPADPCPADDVETAASSKTEEDREDDPDVWELLELLGLSNLSIGWIQRDSPHPCILEAAHVLVEDMKSSGEWMIDTHGDAVGSLDDWIGKGCVDTEVGVIEKLKLLLQDGSDLPWSGGFTPPRAILQRRLEELQREGEGWPDPSDPASYPGYVEALCGKASAEHLSALMYQYEDVYYDDEPSHLVKLVLDMPLSTRLEACIAFLTAQCVADHLSEEGFACESEDEKRLGDFVLTACAAAFGYGSAEYRNTLVSFAQTMGFLKCAKQLVEVDERARGAESAEFGEALVIALEMRDSDIEDEEVFSDEWFLRVVAQRMSAVEQAHGQQSDQYRQELQLLLAATGDKYDVEVFLLAQAWVHARNCADVSGSGSREHVRALEWLRGQLQVANPHTLADKTVAEPSGIEPQIPTYEHVCLLLRDVAERTIGERGGRLRWLRRMLDLIGDDIIDTCGSLSEEYCSLAMEEGVATLEKAYGKATPEFRYEALRFGRGIARVAECDEERTKLATRCYRMFVEAVEWRHGRGSTEHLDAIVCACDEIHSAGLGDACWPNTDESFAEHFFRGDDSRDPTLDTEIGSEQRIRLARVRHELYVSQAWTEMVEAGESPIQGLLDEIALARDALGPTSPVYYRTLVALTDEIASSQFWFERDHAAAESHGSREGMVLELRRDAVAAAEGAFGNGSDEHVHALRGVVEETGLYEYIRHLDECQGEDQSEDSVEEAVESYARAKEELQMIVGEEDLCSEGTAEDEDEIDLGDETDEDEDDYDDYEEAGETSPDSGDSDGLAWAAARESLQTLALARATRQIADREDAWEEGSDYEWREEGHDWLEPGQFKIPESSARGAASGGGGRTLPPGFMSPVQSGASRQALPNGLEAAVSSDGF